MSDDSWSISLGLKDVPGSVKCITCFILSKIILPGSILQMWQLTQVFPACDGCTGCTAPLDPLQSKNCTGGSGGARCLLPRLDDPSSADAVSSHPGGYRAQEIIAENSPGKRSLASEQSCVRRGSWRPGVGGSLHISHPAQPPGAPTSSMPFLYHPSVDRASSFTHGEYDAGKVQWIRIQNTRSLFVQSHALS